MGLTLTLSGSPLSADPSTLTRSPLSVAVCMHYFWCPLAGSTMCLGKSSANNEDTDLVLGNKDNTLNLLGSLNLVATPSAPSGALTVASGITGQGTLSVGSSSTFGGQMVSNATGGLVMNAGSISVKRMTANGHVFLDVDSNGWPVLISKDYCANTSDKYPGCLSDSGS